MYSRSDRVKHIGQTRIEDQTQTNPSGCSYTRRLCSQSTRPRFSNIRPTQVTQESRSDTPHQREEESKRVNGAGLVDGERHAADDETHDPAAYSATEEEITSADEVDEGGFDDGAGKRDEAEVSGGFGQDLRKEEGKEEGVGEASDLGKVRGVAG